jgi:hypothetical protein
LLLLLNRGLPWKLADCWRRAYLQCVGHQKVLVGALPELFAASEASTCPWPRGTARCTTSHMSTGYPTISGVN